MADSVVADGQLPPAVAQYCTCPHWLINILPMSQVIVLFVVLYAPGGVAPINPPQLRFVGSESISTTFEISLPG